jgi:crossover junction endodeoxyribonuclease RusA
MSLLLVSVTLPYPPSANRMWRHVGKKVLRSREYEAWRAQCGLIIRQETNGFGLAGPYAMTVQVGRPDRRRRDLDNLLKPIGDVMVLAGAVEDDCHCQRIDASWSDEVTGVHVRLLQTRLVEPSRAPKNSQTAARSGCAGDEGSASALPSELDA